MSSDLSSPLASPKAKKTVTRTKKAATKAVKATKGDHPSWKDIIRVRSPMTGGSDFRLTCSQECITANPDDSRTGVSRSTIKKVRQQNMFPT